MHSPNFIELSIDVMLWIKPSIVTNGLILFEGGAEQDWTQSYYKLKPTHTHNTQGRTLNDLLNKVPIIPASTHTKT